MGKGKKPKTITLTQYLDDAIYAIARKCPTIHQLFGCKSVWQLTTMQLHWVVRHLSEEFKTPEKKKQKNKKGEMNRNVSFG